MKKTAKILIDVCMALLLLLLFPSARISPSLHVFFGFAIIPIIIIHLLLNGKWLFTSIKNLFSGKLTPQVRYMLFLVIGLVIAFSVTLITGIALYQSNYYSPYSVDRFSRGLIDPSIMFLSRLHGISALACIVLTFLHVKVHFGYLKLFFFKKNCNQNIEKGS